MDAIRPGERIGRYTVLAELASGGMGRVYLARSPGGRTVAVKTLLAVNGTVAPADRRRFAREVALAQRVRGAYTASVVDADAEAPVPWMATEYVAAPSLRDLQDTCGSLPASAVRWLAAGIAEALVSVHTAGLVHRDVKPSNVLLPIEGPRLIDFGISHASDLTRTSMSLGTVAYASPEQARGEPTTPASDVYSLGVTLFQLAVGRLPYRDDGSGTMLEQLARVARGELEPAGLPEELDELVRPCLALDPEARPTPEELLEHCGSELSRRPGAYGAADWLPPAWVAAIGEYRERRVREADEARRRVPPAVTRRAGGRPATRRMPAAERTAAVRGRRRGVLAAVALPLVAGAGLGLFFLLRHGSGTPEIGLADQPLRFLPVQRTAAGACPDPSDPSTLTSGTGSQATCITVASRGGMRVQQLASVRVRLDTVSGASFIVEITFLKADADRWATLTTQAAKQQSPQNQVAIVFGDRLVSVPAVEGPITDGRTDIVQHFSRDQANALARSLGAR